MNVNTHDIYLRTQVNTASPGELTLMLFNGAIKFMKQANESIQKKNYEAKHENIIRATDIFDELLITLNYKYDISKNLSALYIFIKDKLHEANMKLNLESLQVAIRLTTELRDTWAEAVKIVKSGAASTAMK
ncbi:flagellar biosynthesis protein FliS [Gordoniibacillus kamchatkensis]|uniref:Flagellar secretion chaperone FliS n=1 Tax=Gordoniibacillus kamchatkensis TaxID=1590651 RepID=A0ABR5AI83_9BACL|nr:flagellar export chaperone FliS [Paenibacillus sp. VKM B-2647]KIL40655.1 flagellar biosynthesis protein FliS [Paenibacillus sp. VKM B-2647]